jgi:peptidoglycan biosynthesis protein MviN/MurJ (putative lipid II flippase)
MWFIMTALAAVVTTTIWHIKAPEDKYKLGFLSLIFWGATVMWFVDHLMAYLAEREEFFEINLDATTLGLVVIIVALIVWEIALLLGDPKGVFKRVSKR